MKDEFKRLGCKLGASDVKNHIFFRPVHWALLRNSTPPIIPVMGQDAEKDPLSLGLANFRTIRESSSFDLSKETLFDESVSPKNPFKHFETLSIIRQ